MLQDYVSKDHLCEGGSFENKNTENVLEAAITAGNFSSQSIKGCGLAPRFECFVVWALGYFWVISFVERIIQYCNFQFSWLCTS